MMRSLFAGVSGLRNHQVRMDVIGNNIANVNTVGFKAGRVTFEEAFAQLVRGPGSGNALTGGTNPMQVGLGMNIGSIDMLFGQGNLENTGRTTDLAIQGDSFFVVSDGSQNFYTRAGNFNLDSQGRLVAANGFVVQGRQAVAGALTDTVGDIVLPFGQRAAAQPTSMMDMTGNLDASAADGDTRETTMTVFDEQGGRHEVTVTFTKNGANTWDFAITATGGTVNGGDTGTLTFNDDGSLIGPESIDFDFTPDGFGANQVITIDFGTADTIDGLSQFSSASTAVLSEQDGFTMGDLQQISIDQFGIISGSFTNGETLLLGQVALADFNNPSGLFRAGDNMYAPSNNSGTAVINYAGEGSQSVITSGALEMSNVDLAQEFTNMITAQRGFQSNARVITTSDEMLQELVSLKR